MDPRITVLTLGVADLESAVRFYRDGLGFLTEGIVGTEFENGAVAFFELRSGLKLALWPHSSMQPIAVSQNNQHHLPNLRSATM